MCISLTFRLWRFPQKCLHICEWVYLSWDSRPLKIHSSFSIICVALFASKILHSLQVECCMLGSKLKLNFLLDCCLLWAYSWHWSECVQDEDMINIDVTIYLNVSPYFVWQFAQTKIYLQVVQSTMLERILYITYFGGSYFLGLCRDIMGTHQRPSTVVLWMMMQNNLLKWVAYQTCR